MKKKEKNLFLNYKEMIEKYRSEVLTMMDKPKESNLIILKNKVTIMMNTENIDTLFKWLTLLLISVSKEIIFISMY